MSTCMMILHNHRPMQSAPIAEEALQPREQTRVRCMCPRFTAVLLQQGAPLNDCGSVLRRRWGLNSARLRALGAHELLNTHAPGADEV